MKKNGRKSGVQSRSTHTGPAIVAAIFLGLHILPLVWRPNPLWGVDFLFYLPAPIQAPFALLAVLLFIPGFRRLIRSRVGALPFALWGRGQRVWITRILILLVALAAFVALSSARHFLGDGYHVLEKLNAANWHDAHRAPLTYAVIGTLHRLGGVLWHTAENTYRIYSYASGVLYVALCFAVAAAIGRDRLQKSVVLAFLMTTGYMQMFFGYVENYALYLPGLLLYILLGLRTLEDRVPLFGAALLLGALAAFHRAFTAFGPSLLFLAYHSFRRQKDALTWKNATVTVASLCCFPASAALFIGLSGVGIEAYLGQTGSDEFLPLFDEPGFNAQYRIFSRAHVMDFLNQQLLSAPATCMVLFLLRKRDFRHQPFLAICAVVSVLFTFVAKPNIGAFRDWDVFSLPALPLTAWAAVALVRRIRDGERLFHGAFLICGAAGLHTLVWVGLNASAGPSEARFSNRLSGLSGHARASGYITLGKFHRQSGKRLAALEAYKHALDADPTNPNRWLMVGGVYRAMGQFSRAIEYIEKAVELRPGQAVPYMNLGALYSDMGRSDKAIEFTRKAIALQSNLAQAHINLGLVYQETGQLSDAIERLEEATSLQPENAAIHRHLGTAYRHAGQPARAMQHFEKANTLHPGHDVTLVTLAILNNDAGKNDLAIQLLKEAIAVHPGLISAYINLGTFYGETGRYEDGIRYLKEALERQPNHPLVHENLGMNYKGLGRYGAAIEHLEKTLELQGDQANATAFLNVGDTYYDMGEHEKAIPYFQNAIRLNPNHANAHLLLGLSYRALKRGDQARAYFKRTLELEPNHPQAAQIRRWMGKSEE